MNAGLLRNIADLKNLLFKRNSQTSAFQLQDTTNDVIGGNARGIGAVDMQMSRTAANHVASGDFSCVLGQNNRATGTNSVAFGLTNQATGNNATAIGSLNQATGINAVALGISNSATGINGSFAVGLSNTASNSSSVAIGQSNTSGGSSSVALGSQNNASGVSSVALGNSNTAAGDRSFAAGQTNTANGVESVAIGVRGTANAISAIQVYGFNITTVGQTQKSELGVYVTTTNATVTPLTVFAGAPSATNQLTLRNNSVFAVTGKVTARDTATNDAAMFEYKALVKRGANAGTTTIVNSSIVRTFADAAAVAGEWEVSLVADTTNGALQIRGLGEAGKTIRWAAVHDAVEVA